MKWAFGIRRKISAAMLLAAIFVLLFVKNMMDSNNVTRLGSSFSSVYEDRLVVESYIYKLSEHLFRKKIMIDSSRARSSVVAISPAIHRYNNAIDAIIDDYEGTKLTEAEQVHFTAFKENVGQLSQLERDYLETVGAGRDAEAIRSNIDKQFNEAFANLDLLSGIQISEGRLLNEHSQKIVAGSSILTRFEIGILVAIALMIFVLVFESTSVFTKTIQKSSLN